MNALKRIGSLILVVLSAASVILCIAGVVALWMIRLPLTQRVDRTCARVDSALTEVRSALDTLSQLFQQAGTTLKDAREKPPPPDDPKKVETFRQMMLKQMIPTDATPMVQKLIATTTVANSILSDLQELPPDTIPFLDKDQLAQMSDGVSKLKTTTDEVARILGTPEAGTEADVNQEIARIEEALDSITRLILRYRQQVSEVQEKAQMLQAKLDTGIFWGAIGGTVLLVWFTIAQMSLFAHAWSWLRRPSAA